MPIINAKLSTPLIPNRDCKEFDPAHIHVNFADVLGKGAQGRVVAAEIDCDDSAKYRCAGKFDLGQGNPSGLIHESWIYKQITEREHSSRECGVLRYIGERELIDKDGQSRVIALLPRCDVIMDRAIDKIYALKTINKPLYHSVILEFLSALSRGLAHLSKYEIVNLDLKLANFGLHDNTWCMYDFGLAETYDEFRLESKFAKGSPSYMAPELTANDKRYPFMADVWSAGQILRRLLDAPDVIPIPDNASSDQYLREKLRAYYVARTSEGNSPHDDVDYQQFLRRKMLATTDVEQGLYCLLDSMSQLLPEKRPDLETIQFAIEHLSLLRHQLVEYEEVEQFYEQLKHVQEVQPALAFRETPVESSSTATKEPRSRTRSVMQSLSVNQRFFSASDLSKTQIGSSKAQTAVFSPCFEM